jgi:hypothetical protein
MAATSSTAAAHQSHTSGSPSCSCDLFGDAALAIVPAVQEAATAAQAAAAAALPVCYRLLCGSGSLRPPRTAHAMHSCCMFYCFVMITAAAAASDTSV